MVSIKVISHKSTFITDAATELGETTKDAIQEQYSHQLKFTDGEIYRNIRLHASRQDTRRMKQWDARLNSSKRDVLSSLDKRPNRLIRDGFNKSLPFSGLWDALKIGSLKRILSLRCPEVLVSYPVQVIQTLIRDQNAALVPATGCDRRFGI